uniref:Thioesterase n=1 Tax=Candidozyma auris TaxID=498019 RepID=A0A0L0P0J5_CANAR
MGFKAAGKVLVALFFASTYKTLPLVYVLRFYLAAIRTIVLKRNEYRKTRQNTFGITGKNPMDVFRAVSYRTYCSPLELDMFMHKSNSTYFVDLDIARTKFLCTMFQKLFLDYIDNTTGDFKGKGLGNAPYIPVAEVLCTFRKEIKVFEKFTILSNILAWDDKWIYVMSKIVHDDGKLAALSITKYVFKKHGRISMKPKEYLTHCGLYNEAVEKINSENFKLVEHMNKNAEGLEKLAEKMDTTCSLRDHHI